MSRHRRRLQTLLLAVVLASGCALASKGEPLRPRYFALEPELARSPRASPASQASGKKLRLGRIDSSAYLREPIAFRDSAEELGYYEGRRWTEKPEEYLRRELEQALFEEHGFVRAPSGDEPTLEVELIDFSEDRAQRRARVRLRVILHDEHTTLLEQTLELTSPIAHSSSADDASVVVRALGKVLHDAVERTAQAVLEKLEAPPPGLVAEDGHGGETAAP